MSYQTYRVYFAMGERLPKVNVKARFLGAVARPRFNTAGECTFDGKIGIWLIVKVVEA